jgi:hypothetical protein
MSLRDSFPNDNGKLEDIVGIARIVDRGRTVGWIYRTASNRFFIQANGLMPAKDQRAAILHTQSSSEYAVTGIHALGDVPWKRLHIVNCVTSEFKKKR